MSDPFLGEIRMIGFSFAPKGWAHCNGQLLPINQNQALFSLLGTFYGGDGQTTFALPDLRGRTPVHRATSGMPVGQHGGEATHTLTVNEMPAHVHHLSGTSADGTQAVPASGYLAKAAPANPYAAPGSLAPMHASTLATTGGGQAHDNMQPSLVINFCVALVGIYPSRN